jgi:hypothetical protein
LVRELTWVAMIFALLQVVGPPLPALGCWHVRLIVPAPLKSWVTSSGIVSEVSPDAEERSTWDVSASAAPAGPVRAVSVHELAASPGVGIAATNFADAV